MEVRIPFLIHGLFCFLAFFSVSGFSGTFRSMTSTRFFVKYFEFWLISFVRSNFSPKLSAKKSFISFSAVKCWRSLFRVLTLESSCVLSQCRIRVQVTLKFYFLNLYLCQAKKILQDTRCLFHHSPFLVNVLPPPYLADISL